jgi:hypothetical protein
VLFPLPNQIYLGALLLLPNKLPPLLVPLLFGCSVLILLQEAGVVLVALLSCGCIALALQLLAVLGFEPSRKVERVDRTRGSGT